MTASTKAQLYVYYFIISDQENKGKLSITKQLDHRITVLFEYTFRQVLVREENNVKRIDLLK